MLKFFTYKKILLIGLSLFLACAILYGYLLHLTIDAIVARKDAEQDLSLLSQNIAEMETRYIEKQNMLTLSFAYSLGFKDIQESSYATKKASSLTMQGTLNGI
jgi:hypothetical protein